MWRTLDNFQAYSEFIREYRAVTHNARRTGYQEAPYGYDAVWAVASMLNRSLAHLHKHSEHARTHTHAHSNTHSLSLSVSLSHSHTRTHTQTQTLSLSVSLSLTITLSHTHAPTHSQVYLPALTHTHRHVHMKNAHTRQLPTRTRTHTHPSSCLTNNNPSRVLHQRPLHMSVPSRLGSASRGLRVHGRGDGQPLPRDHE